MKPLISCFCSAAITAVLIALAWLLLFPVYDTNDDVAVRIFLEGREIPGAQPSADIFFFNRPLAQAIASLNRLAPGLPWYDVVEHGLLTLTALVAFYCCLRFVRFWDDAAIVALVAAMLLAVFAAIQLTIVATLSTIVGLTALIVALVSTTSNLERFMLSVAGAVVLLVGTLFRIEAALLGIFLVLLAGLYPVISTLRHKGLQRCSSVLIILVTACTGAALAWAYHFVLYFGSPEWKEVYEFIYLFQQLIEYAAGRAPQDVLNQALASVGWTPAELEMLRNWVFFDTNVFSTHKMKLIISNLPVSANASPFSVTNSLSMFVSQFPFFIFGAAGIVLTASRVRTALVTVVLLAAIIVVMVLISVLTKPLPYRVFWPMTVGALFVSWIIIHLDHVSPPHRIQRLAAATLLTTSCLLVAVQTIERSRAVERAHQLAFSDFTRMPVGPKNVLVIIGSAFPLELAERPFAPPYLQRSVQALPLGATQQSPPVVRFMSQVAPDMPTWLCSDAVFIAADKQVLTALQAYYRRHRNQVVSFSNVFSGKTFNVHQCKIAS